MNPEIDALGIEVAESWLQRLYKSAQSTESIVGSYVNYIDPYLNDWQNLYYRQHLNQLKAIKSKYDPTNYFRFPQSIPTND